MKNLENVVGLQEMNLEEMRDVNGGGEWKWGEALFCTAIGGVLGLAAYTIGTMQ
ncbi:class IIb bacteriocin, lactobin A/cerein 7B family [Bacteroides sp. 51]|uniref:class IIb bacteriocin, lactobin A/cerein 7B family n=1 Tax=Bacteroides sp. 51 TaxID=2302938 RepID=UPI0013D417B7|nr:class IIb bacteriocin, lactobin A/cerein 7B family [Bacteroides sp. 51]NDV82104.1 class IIb bacteriocin, lactobin A/cerein 7B family [Bacteroides sp. 51]